jgi:hypothetical protein
MHDVNLPNLEELPLPVEASYINQYCSPNMAVIGNKLAVSYIVDDNVFHDPCDDSDSIGYAVFDDEDSREFDKLMRDYQLSDENEFDLDDYPEICFDVVLEMLTTGDLSEEFMSKYKITDDTPKETILRLARREFNETYNGNMTDEMISEVFRRIEGSTRKGIYLLPIVGYPGKYTSRWHAEARDIKGFWVADDATLANATALIRPYSFGDIEMTYSASKRKKVYVPVLDKDYGGQSLEECDYDYIALRLLIQHTDKLTPNPDWKVRTAELDRAVYRVLDSYASDYLKVKNAIASGEVYGVCWATFVNEGTEDKPLWVCDEDHEIYGGYIGSDCLDDAVLDMFNEHFQLFKEHAETSEIKQVA